MTVEILSEPNDEPEFLRLLDLRVGRGTAAEVERIAFEQ
jgi:hypothetical protein